MIGQAQTKKALSELFAMNESILNPLEGLKLPTASTPGHENQMISVLKSLIEDNDLAVNSRLIFVNYGPGKP